MNKSPLNLPDLKKNRTPIIVLAVVVLFLLIICVVLWLPYILPDGDGGGDTTTDPPKVTTCEELLGRALDASDDSCQTIGSNQICYGNFNVSAQLADESFAQFASLGDTIPVNQLVTLNTAPMDIYRDIWGIAVFKLQANMPGTIPGQNVTFLVFGDTGLYNFSGDMYSIYFSTGIGSVTCSQVPDGLMVDVPDGSGVVFNANGVELALEGDSLLTANPGENMSVTMLNGMGTVTSEGQSQDISAGQVLEIPIGDDLQAEGPPSNPVDISADVALELCLLTGGDCEDPFSWIPTSSVVGSATNTPVPVESGQPTNTSVPLGPTNTTATGANTPTNTTAPAATDTDTPPPTDTPVPTSCSNLVFSGYTLNGNTVSLSITNNNAGPVVIDRVQLSWDENANGLLDQVKTSKTLWGQGGTDSSSPADITFSADKPHRTIDSGGGRTTSFVFENDPAASLSSLTIHFDIGCSKSQ